MKLYEPFVSKAANKKYSVYALKNNKKTLIHFGDKRYGQYRDRIGHYRHLDHYDSGRRELYFKRHGRTSDRNSAKFWSNRILWE